MLRMRHYRKALWSCMALLMNCLHSSMQVENTFSSFLLSIFFKCITHALLWLCVQLIHTFCQNTAGSYFTARKSWRQLSGGRGVFDTQHTTTHLEWEGTTLPAHNGNPPFPSPTNSPTIEPTCTYRHTIQHQCSKTGAWLNFCVPQSSFNFMYMHIWWYPSTAQLWDTVGNGPCRHWNVGRPEV